MIEQGDNNLGAVAGSFTLSAQLCNGKQLTFSGYVLQGETESEVNAKLDLACKVVDRQRMFSEIPELEAKLDGHRSAHEQISDILSGLAAKTKRSSTEEQTMNTHKVNLKRLEKEIERGTEAIIEAKSRMMVV